MRNLYHLTLEDFPQKAAERFLYLSRERDLADGESLHVPGDQAVNVFHIAEGAITFYTGSNPTESEKIGTLREGSFFGEVAVLAGQPRPFLAVAEGETQIDVLQAKAFKRIARDFPDFHRLVTDKLAERLAFSLQLKD